MGAMLAQVQDDQEKAIYYLSKKFLEYEANYSPIEKTSLALVWATKKLRHYMLTHTIHVISRMNPLKYLFEKPILSGKITRWTMILAEFDLTFMALKSIKGKAISDYLADIPVSEDKQEAYDFPEGEIFVINDDSWQLFFDGASNQKGYGIGILGKWKVKSEGLALYQTYLETIFKHYDDPKFIYLSRDENQFADALAKLASMINILNELENIPLCIERREEPTYCMVLDDTTADYVRWYGVPHELISDHGSHFKKDVAALLTHCKTQKRKSSTYRPQMNGAVEAANKCVKTIIEKMTEKYHDWPTKLPFALWGYRTSVKTPTGATPYSLVNRMEGVLPIELEIPSLRIVIETKYQKWIGYKLDMKSCY
ncbi:uncharacterized protein LOC141630435 [Silene latifolia]|uniref:uncharacterized protein LOC141630435 n=1 Tax=Silene latifolia TaxID=37657 RepID=UPI003D783BFA